MRSSVRSLAVLAVVTAAYFAFRAMGDTTRWAPSIGMDPDLSEAMLKVGFWVLPSALAIRVFDRVGYGGVIEALGLRRRLVPGCALGLAAILPMGALILATGPVYFRAVSFVGVVVIGPIAEEVLFRGFLLRQLYRRCRWPPILAIVVSGIAFGLAHLNNLDLAAPGTQAEVVNELFATVGGGLLFAWVAYRWNSIWPAIGLHGGLNLAWALTGASYGTRVAYRFGIGPGDGALIVNATRFVAVIIAVVVTYFATRALAVDVTGPSRPLAAEPL